MSGLKLSLSEKKLLELIWRHEPIGSGDVVRLCKKEFVWEKSTTYTILKKLCNKGILDNQNTIVISLIKKDEFYARQSRQFVEDTFGGSLPKFLTAFIGGKKLNIRQVQELKKLIDEHKEE